MSALPFCFEEICVTSTTSVTRAKVPGGWLVTLLTNGRNNFTTTTTFVADPEWSWEVTDAQKS